MLCFFPMLCWMRYEMRGGSWLAVAESPILTHVDGVLRRLAKGQSHSKPKWTAAALVRASARHLGALSKQPELLEP